MNTVTINFIPCSPAPENGYNLQWRVAGSGDPYTDAGNFTGSPAQFVDELNPEGTCYEGFLQSDCGSGIGMGNQIPWSTPCEESGSTYSIELNSPCTSSESVFLVSGGTVGDIVTVRAYFSGALIKPSTRVQTKAVVSIFSFGGTSNVTASPCYTDESPHSFSLTADTIITMPADTTNVTVIAERFASSAAFALLYVSIIDINGTPVNQIAYGCEAITDTDAVC